MCEKTVFLNRVEFMNQPTNQPRLGFFCDLAFSLAFVSELVFCKTSNLYSLISASFLSALIGVNQCFKTTTPAVVITTTTIGMVAALGVGGTCALIIALVVKEIRSASKGQGERPPLMEIIKRIKGSLEIALIYLLITSVLVCIHDGGYGTFVK